MSEWDITNKVNCIVTDNEAVMVKSCKLLQKTHLPCFAHTINLIVQDSLGENLELTNILKKCKSIVSFFKSSTVAYEKFKLFQNTEKPYSLVQETPTRWNSTYFMVERILQTKEAIAQVLLDTKKAPPPLAADEISILYEVQNLLEIFQDATEKVSGSNYVTSSLMIPMTYAIMQKLENLKTSLTVEAGMLCTAMQLGVANKLSPYESRTSARMATLLDPRFKKEGFSFASNAQQAAIYLEHEVTSTHAKIINSVPTPTTECSASASLFDLIDKRITTKAKTSRSDAIITLRQYYERENLKSDSDPLLFWKLSIISMLSIKFYITFLLKIAGDEVNSIKNLVPKFLCIPATSVESERIFSKCGRIITDRRTRLKSKNVNSIIFCNKNQWLNHVT